MDICSIASSHSTALPQRPAGDTPARAGARVTRGTDLVELSGGQDRAGSRHLRIGLVEDVKAQIAAGTYVTSARLDAALERLMGDLDVTA
ncbi:MAG: hypothetical protein FJ255_01075 [Phycisphaerae bacterium]|nr:hypothetical protein [Phycisphaerae bacterium]